VQYSDKFAIFAIHSEHVVNRFSCIFPRLPIIMEIGLRTLPDL
jgi:hypothetical protein